LPLDEETDSSYRYIVERIYIESAWEPLVLVHETGALVAHTPALYNITSTDYVQSGPKVHSPN